MVVSGGVLSAAFSHADSMLEACLKAGPSDSLPANLLAENLGNHHVGGLSSESYRELATEQFKHFKGHSYTAIRPIAQRIASQAVFMGRVDAPEEPDGSIQAKRLRRKDRITEAKRFCMKRTMPERLKSLVQQIEPIERHPLLEAIEDPNPVMVRWSLMYSTVACLQITGKSYWWMPEVDGQIQIWPIPASWLTPVHENDFYSGWMLRMPGSVEPAPIPGDEVAYFHFPDPSDPFGAKSPLQANAPAVVCDDQMQTAQLAGLKNGMNPGLAVIVGDVTAEDLQGQQSNARPLLDKEQRAVVINTLKRYWAGVTRNGEPAILDALIKDVKKISNTPEEMDFPNSSLMVKTRINEAFGTNPIVTGAITGSTRAEAAVALDNFYDNTTNPLLELLSQVLTKYVGLRFAEEGEKLIVWIEPCRVNDVESKRAELQFLATLGATNRNEIRAALDMPPIKDGDSLLLPMGLMPQAIEIDGDYAVAERTGRSAQDTQRKRLSRRQTKALWLKLHEVNETPLAKAVHKFFLQQRAAVVGRLRAHFEKSPQWLHKTVTVGGVESVVDMVFDSKDWTDKLQEAVAPFLMRAALYGASLELDKHDVSDRSGKAFGAKRGPGTMSVPAKVMEGIKDSMAESFSQPYWDEIGDTTKKRLMRELATSIQEGEGLEGMTAAVEDVLGDDAEDRAAMIARTETTMSLNAGSHAAMSDLVDRGLIVEKGWFGIADERQRETHADLDGTVIPADEDFNVGGYDAPYPGHWSLPPEERVNCILPGTPVEGAFVAGSRAFYRGIVTEIVTRSGRHVTVTPNHRVFAEHGLVAAGALKQGDKIIAYDSKVDSSPGVALIGNEENDEPAKIEQVFESLRLSGFSEVVGAEVDDFHGDGEFCQGEIEIVRIDGMLPVDLESGGSQEVEDRIFSLEDKMVAPGGLGDSLPGFDGRIDNSPCSSLPGGATLTLDKRAVELDRAPLESLRIGTAANLNASLLESMKDCGPAVSAFVCDLLERHAGQVFLDEIVEIREKDFFGHVYDLQSVDGWIVAGDLLVSNCRCFLTSESTFADEADDDDKTVGRLLLKHDCAHHKSGATFREHVTFDPICPHCNEVMHERHFVPDYDQETNTTSGLWRHRGPCYDKGPFEINWPDSGDAAA